MRSERGVELGPVSSSRLSVLIEMPSGAESIPHHFNDDELALKLVASFTRQMKEWPKFEGFVVLLEDGREISREHVKT